MLTLFNRTGGSVLFVLCLPVLFFFTSCSTTNEALERAIALRALEAAYEAGASTSSCGSRYYYEAERQIELGQRAYNRKGAVLRRSGEHFKEATELAQRAEEGAIFCND